MSCLIARKCYLLTCTAIVMASLAQGRAGAVITNEEKNLEIISEACVTTHGMLDQSYGYSPSSLNCTGSYNALGWNVTITGDYAGMLVNLSLVGSYDPATGAGSLTSDGTVGGDTWEGSGTWIFADTAPDTTGMTWNSAATITGVFGTKNPDIHGSKVISTWEDGNFKYLDDRGLLQRTENELPVGPIRKQSSYIKCSKDPVLSLATCSVSLEPSSLAATADTIMGLFNGQVRSVPITNEEKNLEIISEACVTTHGMLDQSYGYSASSLNCTGSYNALGWNVTIKGDYAGMLVNLSLVGSYDPATGAGSLTSDGNVGEDTWAGSGTWIFADTAPDTTEMTWDSAAIIAGIWPTKRPDSHSIVPKQVYKGEDANFRYIWDWGAWQRTENGLHVGPVRYQSSYIKCSKDPVLSLATCSVSLEPSSLAATADTTTGLFNGQVRSVPITNEEKNLEIISEACVTAHGMLDQSYGYSASSLNCTGSYNALGWNVTIKGDYAGMLVNLSLVGSYDPILGAGHFTSDGKVGADTWAGSGTWIFADTSPMTTGFTWNSAATIAGFGPPKKPDIHGSKVISTWEDDHFKYLDDRGLLQRTENGLPVGPIRKQSSYIKCSKDPVLSLATCSVSLEPSSLAATADTIMGLFNGQVRSVPITNEEKNLEVIAEACVTAHGMLDQSYGYSASSLNCTGSYNALGWNVTIKGDYAGMLVNLSLVGSYDPILGAGHFTSDGNVGEDTWAGSGNWVFADTSPTTTGLTWNSVATIAGIGPPKNPDIHSIVPEQVVKWEDENFRYLKDWGTWQRTENGLPVGPVRNQSSYIKCSKDPLLSLATCDVTLDPSSLAATADTTTGMFNGRLGFADAVDVANIAALKAQEADTLVNLVGPETVIYAPVRPDGTRSTMFFYVGEVQGLGGLKVVDEMGDTLALGNQVVNLTGYVRKPAGGEIYLELIVDPVGGGNKPIGPLGMNNKSASTDAKALTNAVRVWGKVKWFDGSTSFTISDGYSVDTYVRVNVNGVELPVPFDTTRYVVVTGVLSTDKTVQAQAVTAY